MHKKLFLAALGLSLLAPALAFGEETSDGTNATTNTSATQVKPEPYKPYPYPKPDQNSEQKEFRPYAASTTKSDVERRYLGTNASSTRPKLDPATEEKIRRAKLLAGEEIERRVRALASTTDKINLMKRVSNSFKGQLGDTIQNEIQKIQALKERIAAGEDPETLKEDIQSITRSHRVFALVVPKAYITAAAEKVVTMTAIMGEMGLKLKNRIDNLGAEGEDVSALLTALESLSAHIDAANAHAQAAINSVANLSADEGDEATFEANKEALKAAREELKAAHEEIKAGRADIKSIVDALKALAPKPNAETTSEPTTEETPAE